MKNKLVITVVCLVAGFAGFRIYGAYHNEQMFGYYMADVAIQKSYVPHQEANVDEGKLACRAAWERYHVVRQHLMLQNLKIYHPDFTSRLLDATPLGCGEDDMGDMPDKVKAQDITLIKYAIDDERGLERMFKQEAEANKRYATNRRLQTIHIFHKTWLALTGTTENPEDWVSFLTSHEKI